jgi:phosphoribosylformylglycinamidine synthase
VAAELPARALADDTPIDAHDLIETPPAEILRHWDWRETDLPAAGDGGLDLPAGLLGWDAVLLRLLDDPTIASKRWVWRQYDHQVQANTVVPPGGADAAVVRLRPQRGEAALRPYGRGVAAVVDCPNRWVALDPERGGMAAVAEAARNLSCVGAEPLAVTDNLNFPSPDTPTGYWQLASACRGLAAACQALATPVTGGNVSLYNETRLPDGRMQPIHPTPVVGMVGLVHDLERVTGLAWRGGGDAVWLLGVPPETGAGPELDERVGLAAGSYLEVLHGLCTGRPPLPDLDLERRVQALVREAIADGLVASAHDLSDGGLAVASAECCLASGLGVELTLPEGSTRPDRLLFAEGGGRILVSVPAAREAAWRQALARSSAGPPATRLGTVRAGAGLVIRRGGVTLLDLPVERLVQSYEEAIPRRLRLAGPPPEH